MKFLSDPRAVAEVNGDDAGQMMVEWVLLTAGVILAFALMLPGILKMLELYFYRIAGTVSLPFP